MMKYFQKKIILHLYTVFWAYIFNNGRYWGIGH